MRGATANVDEDIKEERTAWEKKKWTRKENGPRNKICHNPKWTKESILTLEIHNNKDKDKIRVPI
jgi:hypothetical protein